MPYIPPGTNQIQPISIPIEKTHQLALDKIPKDIPPNPSNEGGSPKTPRPAENDETNHAVKIPPSKESSIESISSAIAATSLYSYKSTPPLEDEDEYEEGIKTQNLSSPATSSVISLPEQQQDDKVKTSRSDSSLRRRVNEVDQEEVEEEEEKKVAGEEVEPSTLEDKPNTTISEDKTAFDLYRQGLYAYTHTLWIQAKLSSSRAERRRQSVSISGQFGAKQSGMERMAAKKALAKRLNG
ncbi:uncharacterized protein I206_107303 [Kwoniella pini CBS 10737]|uniref:Uncharacterized protein n=1 Tax=Kwoniella pini CBS 10737 TaxID=1296096 RepID=A0A1B9HYN3_9TREE|nr:uncharacterized protein I206_05153 [Kwoniella pini CBS 10737]OCF48376.1 hypothetical protein I206_05153 [Kwoniella pini CBS 10737]